MTQEEFINLKTGDYVYVPFIEERGEISTGTSCIGSDSFERFCFRKMRVVDAVTHDYDPEGKEIGWREGCIVRFVKFDISDLTEKEENNFYLTYRDYFPVLSKAWDDVKQYKGYFEVETRHLNEDCYEIQAISLLCKSKRDAVKTINRLNRDNLKRVDAIINFYKKTVKPQVKAFLKSSGAVHN